jgi:inhibitor of cysteine peptidase
MGDRDTHGAMVESVKTILSKDDPETMAVVVSGNLRDGCTQIVDVTSAVEGGEIVVEILTERPADRMCTQALVPFEERVSIDVSGLTGTYRLIVNDYSTTVDLSLLAGE